LCLLPDDADADEALVKEIFKSAEIKFRLADTLLASRIDRTICNYSEGLGWGFGLGALRLGNLIVVGCNPCQATPERFAPVFDYIRLSLQESFGERVVSIDESEQIDANALPRIPITQAHRNSS
jgi:hypothetical protein